jgi:hypothetical protein
MRWFEPPKPVLSTPVTRNRMCTRRNANGTHAVPSELALTSLAVNVCGTFCVINNRDWTFSMTTVSFRKTMTSKCSANALVSALKRYPADNFYVPTLWNSIREIQNVAEIDYLSCGIRSTSRRNVKSDPASRRRSKSIVWNLQELVRVYPCALYGFILGIAIAKRRQEFNNI